MQINKYTIKSIKTMKTMDGMAYTGNIYFENKKVAIAQNSGDGSCTMVYTLIDHDIHRPILTEEFVERLFTLADYEKLFKDNAKKRALCGIAIVTYATHPFEMDCLSTTPTVTMEQIRTFVGEQHPKRIIKEIEIFRSLEDFNVVF